MPTIPIDWSTIPTGTPGGTDWIPYLDASGLWKKCHPSALPGGGGGGTTLATPTLTATVISSTQINLTWLTVANVVSWKLEWSPNGTTGWTQIGGTIAAGTLAYNHTGLTASTAYYYRLTAVGNGTTYLDSGYGTDNDTTSSGFDSDAAIFFASAGDLTVSGSYTNAVAQAAVNQLFIDIKAESGLFAAILGMWLKVGGTSVKHAINAKNPGTYDWTYVGSWTHSGTGAKGDGSTAYAKMAYHYPTLINTAVLSINDYHHSYYGRQSYTSSDEVIIGANGTKPFLLNLYSSDNIYDQGMGGTAIDTVVTPPSYTKLIVQTRTSSTVHKTFRNGVQLGSTDTTASGVTGFADSPANNVTLNAMGSGSPTTSATKFSPLECAFASVGKGLTDSQVTALTNAVNAFQTALSRNV